LRRAGVSVPVGAKSVQGGPDWQRAGIELNPESFETYSPRAAVVLDEEVKKR
jgi:hypothetical protein